MPVQSITKLNAPNFFLFGAFSLAIFDHENAKLFSYLEKSLAFS
jgi:hypothetical protein